MALSSLKHHMGRKIKKRHFLLAFSKQQVVVCKAQAFKLRMLKSKFSGLDSNIIYKAQISLFTDVTSAEMLLTELRLLRQLSFLSTFVSICCLLLFGACSSTEHSVSLFGPQDANRPLNRQVSSVLLLVGLFYCESMLVSLFVVVVVVVEFVNGFLSGYPLNSS